jgi:hypothetical protein
MSHDPHSPEADHDAQMREKLARMSGQIAGFFKNLPTEDAAEETARHINLYWSRSMRRDLGRMFTAQSPQLHEVLRHAWGKIHFPGE